MSDATTRLYLPHDIALHVVVIDGNGKVVGQELIKWSDDLKMLGSFDVPEQDRVGGTHAQAT